jgi:hypothetical protein
MSNRLSELCRLGGVEILNDLWENSRELFDSMSVNKMADDAIDNNQSCILDWLILNRPYEFRLDTESIQRIIYHRKYDMIQWVHDTDLDVLNTYSFDNCTSHGSDLIELLEWYYSMRSTVKLNYTTDFIDRLYYYDSSVAVFEWLIAHEYPIKSRYGSIDSTSTRGSVNLLEWAFNAHLKGLISFEYTTEALNGVSLNAVEVIKWWISHSLQLELKYDHNLFGTGNISVLEYLLYEQDTIKICIDYKVIDRLSYFGCVDCLDLLYHNRHIHGFSYSTDVIDIASRRHALKCLRWWFSKANEINLPYSEKAIDMCCSSNILNLWFDNRDILPLKYTETAITNGTVEWWYKHQDDLELKFDKCYVENTLKSYLPDKCPIVWQKLLELS